MKDWLTKLVIEQLLKQITKEKLEEWLDAGLAALKPVAYSVKDKAVAALKDAAKDTSNTLDDALADKADEALTALLDKLFA